MMAIHLPTKFPVATGIKLLQMTLLRQEAIAAKLPKTKPIRQDAAISATERPIARWVRISERTDSDFVIF